MPKLTRGRLLVGAAPFVAAPVLGKLTLDGDASAADRSLQGHVHDHARHGSVEAMHDARPLHAANARASWVQSRE